MSCLGFKVFPTFTNLANGCRGHGSDFIGSCCVTCEFPESTNAEETALNTWDLEGLNSFCTLEFLKGPVLLSWLQIGNFLFNG